MEKLDAIGALSALAQGTRLDIFRLLVQLGPAGLPAGQIGDRFGLPSATLSFHLGQLKQAGLLTRQRQGRSLIYAADFGAMNALMAFLAENCCQGQTGDCVVPVCVPAAVGTTTEKETERA